VREVKDLTVCGKCGEAMCAFCWHCPDCEGHTKDCKPRYRVPLGGNVE
jgi:hypothetical protein